MASRVYGYQGYGSYQYDTTPRKLQPEYEPQEIKKAPQKSAVPKARKKTNQTTKSTSKKQGISKEQLKRKSALISYIVLGFALLFTISYRDSVINEKFNKKESLKAELTEIQKTNEQLEVALENELNLNSVESTAKDELGMSKLSNNQKIYVNLPKREYVEARTETIANIEDQGIFQNLFDKVTSIFN